MEFREYSQQILSDFISTYGHSLDGWYVYYESRSTTGSLISSGLGIVVESDDNIFSVQELYCTEEFSDIPIYYRDTSLYEYDIIIPLWKQ